MKRLRVGLGVDIGGRFIRMAMIRCLDSNMILEKCEERPMPENAADSGTIKNPEMLSEIIRELWKSMGVREVGVVSAVAVQHALVRTLKLPNMVPRELCTAARYKAVAMMPTPMQETVVEVASFGEPDENGQVEVSVVAARRNNVEVLKKTLILAGLKPVAVEIPMISCFRVFDPAEETVGILDLSNSAACLSIFQNRCIKMSRVLVLDGTHPGFEAKGTPGELLAEINQSMEYYGKRFGHRGMDKLILAGVSRNSGLEDYLSQQLSYPVSAAEIQNLIMPDMPEEWFDNIIKNYPVAIGLALRKCS